MNKEEVLQASRKENKNLDVYELEVISGAQRIGGIIGVCVAFTLMVVEAVLFDNGANYGFALIIFSASAGLWICKAVKLKRKHEILLAVSHTLLCLFAAVKVVLGYIG